MFVMQRTSMQQATSLTIGKYIASPRQAQTACLDLRTPWVHLAKSLPKAC